MQALISLPSAEHLQLRGTPGKALCRRVCGLPMLARTVITAVRSGCTGVVLLHPADVPLSIIQKALRHSALRSVSVRIQALDHAFRPEDPADWQNVEPLLEEKFLWLPWNRVLDKRRLQPLVAAGQASGAGARFEWPAEENTTSSEQPLALAKHRLAGSGYRLSHLIASDGLRRVELLEPPGVMVTSKADAAAAEHDLVRWSGKEWDGIFSQYNRQLCWPVVRYLSKTPVTPNLVTFTGLLIAILSGWIYMQGSWAAQGLGGLLFFTAVLFDEIDGMLARVTFKDSPFGCWLETFVDYASYVLVYGGIIWGLYVTGGREWLMIGAALFFGVGISILVISHQRTLATHPDRPDEYQIRFYNRLEEDSGNVISRMTRKLQFLIKKAVFAHHLLWFSAAGILKLHILLSVIGVNLTWIIGLYHNRLFRPRRPLAGKPLQVDKTGTEV